MPINERYEAMPTILSPTRTLMSFRTSVILEIAISALTVLAIAVISVVAEDFIDKQLMDSWAASALIAIMACILGLATMASWIIRKLIEVEVKVGLSVRYVENEKSRAALFRELRSVVAQARERIVIVNAWSTDVSEMDDDPEVATERSQYFDTLIDRARNGGVLYHRVIQAPEGTLAMEVGRDRLRHFHRMLDEKEKNSARIFLTRTSEKRPLNFTLVDNRWFMLEVDQRDAKGGLHMAGILILDDPQQVVSRDFERFYESMSFGGSKGSIEREHLPSLPSD